MEPIVCSKDEEVLIGCNLFLKLCKIQRSVANTFLQHDYCTDYMPICEMIDYDLYNALYFYDVANGFCTAYSLSLLSRCCIFLLFFFF